MRQVGWNRKRVQHGTSILEGLARCLDGAGSAAKVRPLYTLLIGECGVCEGLYGCKVALILPANGLRYTSFREVQMLLSTKGWKEE